MGKTSKDKEIQNHKFQVCFLSHGRKYSFALSFPWVSVEVTRFGVAFFGWEMEWPIYIEE